jgi:hypothetical protein
VDGPAEDTFARAIAILSLGASVLATTIAALSYRRDRPKLKMAWIAQREPDSRGPLVLHVHVTNDGRRAASLASVQLISSGGSEVPRWRLRAAGRFPRLASLLRVGVVERVQTPGNPLTAPVLLGPREPLDFRFDLDRVRSLFIDGPPFSRRQLTCSFGGRLWSCRRLLSNSGQGPSDVGNLGHASSA